MYGAFLGDMIGAPYEFDRGKKTKDFPLFCGRSEYTDDSVMTVAVATIIAVKHADNIKRLAAGKERRIGERA